MPKSFLRAAVFLPIAVPAVLATTGAAVMALLLYGQLVDWLVWPIVFVITIATITALWYWLPKPTISREQLICTALLLLGVLAWGIFNTQYTSQHLLTNRDPATYANAAAWLVKHENLKISTPAIFNSPNVTTESPGFMSGGQTDAVYAQGQHLFPILLGLGGRIVSQDLMLHLPIFFGMTALLAMYSFAQLPTKPRWALLATGVIAVSLPMLYFSRDTFTEPLSLTLVFGAMALLWQAVKTGQVGLWALAGIAVGASALTRIDAYITIAGFLLFIAVFLATRQPGQRFSGLKNTAAFLLPVVLLSVLGVADLLILSPYYFNGHKSLLAQELLVCAAAVAGGLVAMAIAWRTKFISWLDKISRPWRKLAIIAAVILVALAIVSRPLWYTETIAQQSGFIAGVQVGQGDPPSPRGYSEQSATWVGWYIGPILAAAGAVGLGVAAARSFKNIAWLIGFFVVGVTAVIYLIKPSIAPDQIWAARRFLPVILPGLAVFGVVAFAWLGEKLLTNRLHKAVFFILASIALIVAPLLTSKPFLTTRDTAQLPLIADFCKALPKKAVVLWLGDARHYNVQATRSFCNVPAYAYTASPVNPQDLKVAASSAYSLGYAPVIALFSGDDRLVGRDQVTQVSQASYDELEPTLQSPPEFVYTKQLKVLAGQLRPDGTIVKLQER